MRVPVYILIATDPVTGEVNPTAVNANYDDLVKVKEHASETMEMSMFAARPEQKAAIQQVIGSLRIVTGLLEIDLES